ncbi:uncharacterized protein LOC128549852 [Mercenaria mercenaria]|uniref:uncharacterized protein LOC128549852 n=1 Tax=Mercenaria mercenaria TaxID=6596 RepID=UPI00234F2F9D|nr:uncharacterized protein LOC128549852 [Mercenaria mercenaria]
MTWEIDKKAAAECTYDSCETYITGVGNYGFSFDTNKGIFNITLDPVTFAVNERIFKCDDGSNFAYINALVKVVPDNSATTITSSKGSSFTEIKARTGCLHPSSSVTFEWYYFYIALHGQSTRSYKAILNVLRFLKERTTLKLVLFILFAFQVELKRLN